MLTLCISFMWPLEQITTNLVSQKKKNKKFSPRSGGWKSKIKCEQGHTLLRCQRRICLQASSNSRLPLSKFLATSGIPWLKDSYFSPVSLHVVFTVHICVLSVSIFPLFHQDISYIKLGPYHNNLILTLVNLQRLFSNKLTLFGMKGLDFSISFRENTI